MHTQPWLATYRANGIPAEINADAYPSVVAMLDEAMMKQTWTPPPVVRQS
jgi:long-chain acyl-CoA synthetase